MKNQFRASLLTVSLILVCLFTGLLMSAPKRARAGDQATPPGLKRLLDDDEQFQKRSSGAQFRLRRMFGSGTKQDIGSSQKQNPPGQDKSGSQSPSLSPIANPLVNDTSADTGAQDTQSETTLVLGGGSNLIAGFNDSGAYTGSASSHFTGFSRSTDGGKTWKDGGSLPF